MQPPIPSDASVWTLSLPRGPAAIRDEGTGPPVIALHGAPGSSRDFRWLAPAATPSLRLIRVDRPGFGETPQATGPGEDTENYAAFAIEVMDALKIDRAVMLGHSLGGAAALRAAAGWPDRVAGVATICGPGFTPHRMYRRAQVRLFSKLLRSRLLRALFAGPLRRGFEKTGFPRGTPDDQLVRTLHCAAAIDFDAIRADAESIDCPSFVAWTEDDPFIEPEIPAAVGQILPDGPRLCFPDGRHNPQKTYAIEIADALEEWVRGFWS